MAESYNLCLDIGGTKVLGVVFNSTNDTSCCKLYADPVRSV